MGIGRHRDHPRRPVGPDGTVGHVFHSGESMTIRLHLTARTPVKDFVFGIGLFNADGVCIYGTNTNIEEMSAQEISGDGQVDFVIEELALTEGTFKLDLAVHKLDGSRTTTIASSTPSASSRRSRTSASSVRAIRGRSAPACVSRSCGDPRAGVRT